MLKEAVFQAMEDLRYLCRARNINQLYAYATNLYEWQIVYYNRQRELLGKDHFFQVGEVQKLYVKENNYQYGENQMKAIIGIMRSVIEHTYKDMVKYQKASIVEYQCIDNCDEFFWINEYFLIY